MVKRAKSKSKNKSASLLDRLQKFTKSEFRFKKIRIPNMVVVGVISVIFLYVSVAGMVSVTAPWFVRGDTRQHIDYTWRLSHGDIPRWKDNLRYPPLVKKYGLKREAASANPPLFYLIHVPFVSPLLNQGKLEKAIAAGRAVNIFIGVICILTLAWAGWLFGGKRSALFSVAVPAVTVLMARFTNLNIDYALDALVTIFATLALINSYKLITQGIKTNYLIWAAVISVLGMATKATYIIPLTLNLLAIVWAAFLHSNRKQFKQNMIRAVIYAAAIFLLVVIAIGWFYYFWNYKSTGDWFSSAPVGYTGGRVPKSLFEVLTSSRLWNLFYSNYINLSLSIAISSFALAGYLTISKTRVKQFFNSKQSEFLGILLLFTVIGTFGTQITHAVGIGAINFRYMLPALLPFGLFLSFGLLEFKNLRGQLVAVASIGMGIATLTGLGLGVVSRGDIYDAVIANGIPTAVPKIIIMLFVLGAGLLVFALFNLTGKSADKS